MAFTGRQPRGLTQLGGSWEEMCHMPICVLSTYAQSDATGGLKEPWAHDSVAQGPPMSWSATVHIYLTHVGWSQGVQHSSAKTTTLRLHTISILFTNSPAFTVTRVVFHWPGFLGRPRLNWYQEIIWKIRWLASYWPHHPKSADWYKNVGLASCTQHAQYWPHKPSSADWFKKKYKACTMYSTCTILTTSPIECHLV